MDNSSLYGTSISERENSQAVGSSTPSLGRHNMIDKVSTDQLGELKINDGNETHTEQRIRVERSYIEEEEEDEEDLSEEALLAQMGYAKSESKRDHGEGEDEDEDEDDDLSEDSLLAQMGYQKNEPPKHEPITSPMSDINLVSAFKGSREKEGKPPKECRVSWAPDVFDPPCTSDEHFAPTKIERLRSELKVKGVAGKNRQKSGGKRVGSIEGGGGGGKGNKGLGGSKGSLGGSKAAGKIKDKKKADKKTKKRGGTTSKISDYDED